MSEPKSEWTRRTFLKVAGTGAVAAAGAGLAPAIVRGAAKEIVIGCQADLTGGFASWGYWLEKAAKAAVERINREGGIGGRPVKYVVEDTESNPVTGTRKMRRLIQREEADFLIGTVH